jgi:hypothetical protein
MQLMAPITCVLRMFPLLLSVREPSASYLMNVSFAGPSQTHGRGAEDPLLYISSYTPLSKPFLVGDPASRSNAQQTNA